jgi:Protein of unknown function (DUF2795)
VSQPGFTEVQKFLTSVSYPATKDELLRHAEEQGASDDVVKVHKWFRIG